MYDTEKSYVEALKNLVTVNKFLLIKYLHCKMRNLFDLIVF